MTEEWALPEDLTNITVHGDTYVDIGVSHFDGETYLTASDNNDAVEALVTADDLRFVDGIPTGDQP